MLIAITGGSGYIGRKLVSTLIERGHIVRILTRQKKVNGIINGKADLFYGDLLDDNFKFNDFFENVDVLYHCAAVSKDADRMYKTNVLGLKNLLKAASGKIKHWVQLSSVGVYGRSHDGIISEDAAFNPTDLYGKTKAEAESLVIRKSKEGGFTYTILRPSKVYGTDILNQSASDVFKMIDVINRNLFFYIGNKRAIVNYIHIDNVVESLIICGEENEAVNEIFNISDNTKLETVVKVISNKLNKKTPILILPQSVLKFIAKIFRNWVKWPLTESRIDGLTNVTIYSNKKIEKKLKYKHKISIKEGFEELTEFWIKNNR